MSFFKLDAATKKSSSPKASKKLNCKIEQCGGRCLRTGEVCRLVPTKEQAKLWGAANKVTKDKKTNLQRASSPIKNTDKLPRPATLGRSVSLKSRSSGLTKNLPSTTKKNTQNKVLDWTKHPVQKGREYPVPSTDKRVHSIKKQEDFEQVVAYAMQELDKEKGYDGLIPIYRLREKLGETVPRNKFGEMLKEMVAKDQLQAQGGSIEDGAIYKAENSISQGLDGLRTYVRLLNTEEGNRLRKLVKNKEKVIVEKIKNPPGLDDLGSARINSVGTKIDKQEDFNKILEDTFNRFDKEFNLNNSVSIFRLKQVLRDRVTGDIDAFLRNSDKFQMVTENSATNEDKKAGLTDVFGDTKTHLQKSIRRS